MRWVLPGTQAQDPGSWRCTTERACVQNSAFMLTWWSFTPPPPRLFPNWSSSKNEPTGARPVLYMSSVVSLWRVFSQHSCMVQGLTFQGFGALAFVDIVCLFGWISTQRNDASAHVFSFSCQECVFYHPRFLPVKSSRITRRSFVNLRFWSDTLWQRTWFIVLLILSRSCLGNSRCVQVQAMGHVFSPTTLGTEAKPGTRHTI